MATQQRLRAAASSYSEYSYTVLSSDTSWAYLRGVLLSLSSVRKLFPLSILCFLALAVVFYAPYSPIERSDLRASTRAQLPATPQTPESGLPPASQPPQQPAASQPAPAPNPPPLTVVLDPAHGGADNGARGPNGLNEKDVVLALCRGIRAELAQRGYRVVMTRDSDADPTFDDRATMANQAPGAIFVSIHVASTGTPGTARIYYYRLPTPFTYSTNAGASTPAGSAAAPQQPPTTPLPAAIGLIPWRHAQSNFDDASHRFADLVQAAIAQKFAASPAASSSAAVRDLRSIAGPAIAIELSSVASLNASSLEAMGPSVASAIAQGLSTIHPASETSLSPLPPAPGAPR